MASFNVTVRQMTEMFQRKKKTVFVRCIFHDFLFLLMLAIPHNPCLLKFWIEPVSIINYLFCFTASFCRYPVSVARNHKETGRGLFVRFSEWKKGCFFLFTSRYPSRTSSQRICPRSDHVMLGQTLSFLEFSGITTFLRAFPPVEIPYSRMSHPPPLAFAEAISERSPSERQELLQDQKGAATKQGHGWFRNRAVDHFGRGRWPQLC